MLDGTVAIDRPSLCLRGSLPADRRCSSCSLPTARCGWLLRITPRGGLLGWCVKCTIVGSWVVRYAIFGLGFVLWGPALNGIGTTTKGMSSNRGLVLVLGVFYVYRFCRFYCLCIMYVVFAGSSMCAVDISSSALASACFACCRCDFPTSIVLLLRLLTEGERENVGEK